MKRKRLIVNADDFGLTEGINRAIVRGHKNGIITSATVMANGAAFESAAEASRHLATLGVGVHLNLTQGPPVADVVRVRSLVGRDGLLLGSPGILARRVLTRKADLNEVECEFRKQIEKVAAAGVRITHLDSHKHVHVLPPIFDIVIRLAGEFGIPSVRCPVESMGNVWRLFRFGSGHWLRVAKQYTVARVLSGFAAWQQSKLSRARLRSAEHFCGLSETGFLDSSTLERILRTLPDGATEMMCHPGYADAALFSTRTRLRAEREIEINALTQPAIRQLADAFGIELINYADLAADTSGAAESLKRQNGSASATEEAARKV